MNIYYDVEDNHYRTYPDGDIATTNQMTELIENKNLSIAKLQQENKQLKEKVNKLEILIENLKLGVTLNQEQEDLLDEILFRESRG